MPERASDRWVSIMLSVLLHGTLIAALVYGFWTYHKSRPPTPTLAIEATAVDPRTLNAATRQAIAQPKPQPAPAPVPQPPPEPQEPTGPPQPTQEELAQREAAKEQAAKEQAAKEEAEREAVDKQRQAEAQKQQQEADRQAQEKRQLEQKREQERQAEAQRKAKEQKATEEKLAQQKRAEAQQRQADEKARAEREAELKSSLAAEEHAMAARSSGALASWEAQITARIQRAWLRPPSARPGIECVLYVTQVPGGAVVNVKIGTCNGDEAVRESIEAAAYRASPLPPPPDPSLFERNLEITFKPD